MELLQRARNIRMRLQILVVVFRIALALPPEPVLHNEVQRHMLRAIFARNLQQLLRRLIAILRLHKAISPLAEKWRVTRHLAILVNNLIDLRSIEEVVVNSVRCYCR